MLASGKSQYAFFEKGPFEIGTTYRFDLFPKLQGEREKIPGKIPGKKAASESGAALLNFIIFLKAEI
jgi:hypothetical protein